MNEKNLLFIGKNVNRLRKALRLTQEQLALRANLSQSYINQLESSKKGFSRDSLLRVAKALDVPVDSIFEKDGSTKSARSSKKLVKKDPVIEYVVVKPEPYEVRRNKKKKLTNELLELAKLLPEETVEHYIHLLKMEADSFKKKK